MASRGGPRPTTAPTGTPPVTGADERVLSTALEEYKILKAEASGTIDSATQSTGYPLSAILRQTPFW